MKIQKYNILIRNEILKRDNFKCSFCGSNKDIEVHHKNKNRLDNRKNNLITLCKKCHLLEYSSTLQTNHIKMQNQRMIIQFVKNNPQITISEISRRTNLSYPTSLNHVNNLIKEGVLKEKTISQMRIIELNNDKNKGENSE